MLYRVVQLLLRPLFGLYFRWRFEDFHHLPKAGPAILAPNHVNYLDPLIIGAAVPRPIHFMAKQELFQNRALAWLLRKVYAFPVKRGQPDRQSIRHALKMLEEGHVVGIYPEGTRSETGELQDGKAGVAMIALKSGAPVVPMAVVGLERALDSGGRRLPRRSAITLRMGPPLTFERVERLDRATLHRAAEEVHRAIAALLPGGAEAGNGSGEALDAGPASPDNSPLGRKGYATGGKEV